MTFRVRDTATINKNQLNSSVSKQQYTIPKAQRFRHNKTQCSYRYYDLPSTNERKAPGFGASQRKTFITIDKDIPPPNNYFKNGDNKLVIQSHSITFAKGRQECKNYNFLRTINNPGPGAYSPNPQITDPHVSTKFSFRAISQQIEKQPKNRAPAPNRYTIKDTWLLRDKILSTDKNYGCPLIRPSKYERSITEGQLLSIPLYNPSKNMKGEDTFTKTGGFSIGKSLRFNQRMKTQIPGPGTYERFSQF